MIFLRLYWEFFKIGLFAIGGGQATIPYLTRLSETSGWYSISQLVDMIAISESTPGPIGVNMATYVGYSIKGIPGSLTATLGLITPSIIIILIVAKILQKFKGSKAVENTFYGIRPASSGLICAALITLCKLCLLDIDAYKISGKITDIVDIKVLAIFALIMVLTNIKKLKKLHPIVFVAFSALLGIIFRLS